MVFWGPGSPEVTMVDGEIVAAVVLILQRMPTEEEGKALMQVQYPHLLDRYVERHGHEPDMAAAKFIVGIRHPSLDWRDVVTIPGKVEEIEALLVQQGPNAVALAYIMKEVLLDNLN